MEIKIPKVFGLVLVVVCMLMLFEEETISRIFLENITLVLVENLL